MKIPARKEDPPRDDLDLERGGKREDKINRHVEELRQYAQQSSLISLTIVIQDRNFERSSEVRFKCEEERKMHLKVSSQVST